MFAGMAEAELAPGMDGDAVDEIEAKSVPRFVMSQLRE